MSEKGSRVSNRYLAVEGLGAELCQGDLALLDTDKTEILRGINNRE